MKFKRTGAVALSLAIAFSFAACTDKENDAVEEKETPEIVNSAGQKFENPLKPFGKETKIEPDLSQAEIAEPSQSIVLSKSVEECVERLAVFANPNGNEYDAVALLGKHSYPNDDEAALLKRFKTASDEWHKKVKTEVGDKCTVRIVPDEVTMLSADNEKVLDWQAINSAAYEDFASVKCRIATNYSTEDIRIIVDFVKVDGNWYLASVGTLNKLQNVIVDEIFK